MESSSSGPTPAWVLASLWLLLCITFKQLTLLLQPPSLLITMGIHTNNVARVGRGWGCEMHPLCHSCLGAFCGGGSWNCQSVPVGSALTVTLRSLLALFCSHVKGQHLTHRVWGEHQIERVLRGAVTCQALQDHTVWGCHSYFLMDQTLNQMVMRNIVPV